MAGLLPLLFFANSRTRVNDPSLLVPFLTICVKVATPLADLLVSLEQRKENKISHRKKKSIDCWLGDAKTRFESGSSWPSHVWETDCQVRSVRGAIKKKSCSMTFFKFNQKLLISSLNPCSLALKLRWSQGRTPNLGRWNPCGVAEVFEEDRTYDWINMIPEASGLKRWFLRWEILRFESKTREWKMTFCRTPQPMGY